jgi:hypothetical protein
MRVLKQFLTIEYPMGEIYVVLLLAVLLYLFGQIDGAALLTWVLAAASLLAALLVGVFVRYCWDRVRGRR